MTADGSLTLFVPELMEHYHSTHGAVQESRHIFITAGLGLFSAKQEVSVLEIGFGTGLNAFLSMTDAEKNSQKIFYTAVDNLPLAESHYSLLNYPEVTGFPGYAPQFRKLHTYPWDVPFHVTEYFVLEKVLSDIGSCKFSQNKYDLVYFDAFGPDVQPELWKEAIFIELFKGLKPGGILVTYSAKGSVRRALKSAGFVIEKLPGPKGKREMTRAKK